MVSGVMLSYLSYIVTGMTKRVPVLDTKQMNIA